MSHYYFDRLDGDSWSLDPEGIELASLADATAAALAGLWDEAKEQRIVPHASRCLYVRCGNDVVPVTLHVAFDIGPMKTVEDLLPMSRK